MRSYEHAERDLQQTKRMRLTEDHEMSVSGLVTPSASCSGSSHHSCSESNEANGGVRATPEDEEAGNTLQMLKTPLFFTSTATNLNDGSVCNDDMHSPQRISTNNPLSPVQALLSPGVSTSTFYHHSWLDQSSIQYHSSSNKNSSLTSNHYTQPTMAGPPPTNDSTGGEYSPKKMACLEDSWHAKLLQEQLDHERPLRQPASLTPSSAPTDSKVPNGQVRKDSCQRAIGSRTPGFVPPSSCKHDIPAQSSAQFVIDMLNNMGMELIALPPFQCPSCSLETCIGCGSSITDGHTSCMDAKVTLIWAVLGAFDELSAHNKQQPVANKQRFSPPKRKRPSRSLAANGVGYSSDGDGYDLSLDTTETVMFNAMDDSDIRALQDCFISTSAKQSTTPHPPALPKPAKKESWLNKLLNDPVPNHSPAEPNPGGSFSSTKSFGTPFKHHPPAPSSSLWPNNLEGPATSSSTPLPPYATMSYNTTHVGLHTTVAPETEVPSESAYLSSMKKRQSDREKAKVLQQQKDEELRQQRQQDNDMMERVLTILISVLPSTDHPLVPSLFKCGTLLEGIARLLRDSVAAEGNKPATLYQKAVTLIRLLSTNPSTSSLILLRRAVYSPGHSLLEVSLAKNYIPASVSDAQALISIIGSLKFQYQRTQRHKNSRKERESLCHSISDLYEDLKLQYTQAGYDPFALPSESWQESLRLLEIPDDVMLKTNVLAAKQDERYPIVTPGRMKRINDEIIKLDADLPAGIFVRYASSRPDMMKVLIMGPAGSPYAHGLFEFDLVCPRDFPLGPPEMLFRTTAGGCVRFNPNLYADGKVCLSLLGTWSGEPWTADSTLLQLLVSIQSMVFTEKPWANEPGVAADCEQSDEYSKGLWPKTVEHGMLDWLEKTSYEGKIKDKIPDLVEDALLGPYGESDDDAFAIPSPGISTGVPLGKLKKPALRNVRKVSYETGIWDDVVKKHFEETEQKIMETVDEWVTTLGGQPVMDCSDKLERSFVDSLKIAIDAMKKGAVGKGKGKMPSLVTFG